MTRRGLTAAVLDRMIYAPIGLAFELERLLPELADRGRRQVELSRRVGKSAVDGVLRRAGGELESALDGFARGRRPPTPTEQAQPPAREAALDNGSGATPDDLAIPGYDSLAASQVVPRLRGLTGAERAAVREYELATRGRRTILTAIARLDA